ncbi:uncharacterized protein PV07_00840 [Cladophialophora immunda]|uniref:Uncharacterized protein n=1 Tax=Cladophialophora immunda TaxID=569365 RepID=A0A0D2CS95_9EURO|nr:uncharacterized protein PV07_00840 [Cladophialophora immunda]KIW34038.1 hypothetical protein PV07_00840 [Cladophialophora immunda]OQV03090.1 hypothetical protein CLAIMM_08183 isoform 1 [Cladophialophora immunda]OQV03091.1 hypothetical protein CLAIMM_08183 isoform 2 [Cladophialophora immunda]
MTLWTSIKPFWPLLFTFVLPRAINYYGALKTAYRTRPPPRPLPKRTSRGVNALFASICVFLYASWPLKGDVADHNVFVATQSRLSIPTDVLFERLALLRENRVLSAADEALRAKLTSPALRQLYLRFGPSTLRDCLFCHPDDPFSYLLYHLPTNTVLPHLLHILCLGLATSETVAGYEASTWRRGAILGALALAGTDLFLTSTYAPAVATSTTAPAGTFWVARTARYLSLCAFDALVALCIYASATGRFYLFPTSSSGPAADPELARRRTDELLTQANLALQMAATNLRAYSIARNAVVRNPALKDRDDAYWRAVVAVEGSTEPGGGGAGTSVDDNDDSLYEDEEVQAAVARAYGTGAINIASVRREAEAFVRHATRGLDAPTPAPNR